MKLLSKIPLRPKLMLLVLLPFSLLGYLTFEKIDQQQQIIEDQDEVRRKLDLIAHAVVVIHELQLERDHAINYLVNPDNEKQKILDGQIVITDTVITNFRDYIVSTNSDSSYITIFNPINEVRPQITWFKVDEKKVGEAYSFAIQTFIEKVTRLSHEAKTTKTKEDIVAYISLLNAKENLGKIRTVLNKALVYSKFYGYEYGTFAGYKNEWETNFNEFMKYAPEELRVNFIFNFSDIAGPSGETLNMINKCFEKGTQGLAEFDAETWWLKSTGTLNILHEQEVSILERIIDNIRIQEEEIKGNIDDNYVFLTGTLAFLLLLVYFSILSITAPLKRIQKAANAIQEGNTLVKIPVYTHDEIGKLASAFNSMSETENLLAQVAETIGNGDLDVEIEPRSDEDVLGKSLKSMKDSLKETRSELKTKLNELEQAYKYKSEFLANMSHELRTPLNSLLILSELLSSNKHGNLKEDQIESLKVINRSGRNLLNLINDILDLSKIEAGQLDVNIESVDREELVQSLNDVFVPISGNKSIKFEVDISEGTPRYFESDGLRLGQILKNLLSNAHKFTSEGGRVTLKIYAKDDLINFEVIDSGIGIPKDKQKTIFDAFKQADGSTSRNYGGTGLGLSITKNLVSLLAGNISVESVEDKGSTFKVSFPLVAVVIDESEVSAVVSSEPEPNLVDGEIKSDPITVSETKVAFTEIDSSVKEHLSGKKLLVIDEDISNVFEIGSALAETELEVVEASSLEELREKLETSVDFVLFNPGGFNSNEVKQLVELINSEKLEPIVFVDIPEIDALHKFNQEDGWGPVVEKMIEII